MSRTLQQPIVARLESYDDIKRENAKLRARLERLRNPKVYEGPYYAVAEVPEVCPECDSKAWISHGAKGMCCHICFLIWELDAANSRLEEMTMDRNLWQDQHNGDCPNKIALEAAEARLAILDAQQVESSTKRYSPITQRKSGDPTMIEIPQGMYVRYNSYLDALRAIQAWRDVARDYRTYHGNCKGEDACFRCRAYDALAGEP